MGRRRFYLRRDRVVSCRHDWGRGRGSYCLHHVFTDDGGRGAAVNQELHFFPFFSVIADFVDVPGDHCNNGIGGPFG